MINLSALLDALEQIFGAIANKDIDEIVRLTGENHRSYRHGECRRISWCCANVCFAAGVFELTIGIGIIGAGMVGQMCHLANFVANPGCRVVALADLRPELAAAAAAKFGVQRVYRTHLEMLADSEVTAVVVVTRRRATGPIVLDALNSGRHVLSEKPMAYTRRRRPPSSRRPGSEISSIASAI